MSYAITGIKAGLGPGEQVPLRREIDEWWFSKDKNDLNQRSLFMYALRDFMKMDPKKQLSYFGIAGNADLLVELLISGSRLQLTSKRHSRPTLGALGYSNAEGRLVLCPWHDPVSYLA